MDHKEQAGIARAKAEQCITITGRPVTGDIDVDRLRLARQVGPRPKRAGIWMSLMGLLGWALVLNACGAGFKEIKFVEAHGCGGATAAVIMDDDSSHAMTTSVCGYALETDEGVVGCAVVEQVQIDGVDLGAGAVPPSAPQCYEDGHFGPFRLGALISAIIPANATRGHPQATDAHSAGGGQGSGAIYLEWADEGSD